MIKRAAIAVLRFAWRHIVDAVILLTLTVSAVIYLVAGADARSCIYAVLLVGILLALIMAVIRIKTLEGEEKDR